MTDKNIIIDGVEVSGCEFLLENSLHKIEFSCICRGNSQENALHLHLHCKNNPNCYYKQLKRKEQECERLDNEAQNLFTEKTNLSIELDQLKAELQATKGLVTTGNKQFMQTMEKIEKLEAEIETKQKALELQKSWIENLEFQRTNLKQALQEIKEIANVCLNQDVCAFCNYSDNCYMEDKEIPTYDICKLILQKINEEEDE